MAIQIIKRTAVSKISMEKKKGNTKKYRVCVELTDKEENKVVNTIQKQLNTIL